ncbi:hypothetical protein P8815_18015 [Bacillus altitudinis]|uniref:hypothetical protein n=1 Tax=Bacillus altitudinis TaxID=293387 RepID=UPI0020C01E23|nr:hypothetical protein [Bacillus altitudinis]MEC0473636.1 hypothetical protein [Bacillus altitudinis]
MNKNEVFDFNIGITVLVELDYITRKKLGLKSNGFDLFIIEKAFVDDEIHIYEVYNKKKGIRIQAYATDLIPVDLGRDEIVD